MATKILKDISLFIDGRGYAGDIEEFEPPKLALKTEEHRGGGMDAPVEVDMGMGALTAGITLSHAAADALKLFGLGPGSWTPLTLRGSQESETGEVEAVIYSLRGRFKEADPGTWKPGEKAPLKMMMALRYYKLEIGGETIHEIDVEGGKRVIDGTDRLAERRRALGL